MGRIHDIVSPSVMHPLMRSVLVNAIYFKGETLSWSTTLVESVDLYFWDVELGRQRHLAAVRNRPVGTRSHRPRRTASRVDRSTN